MDAFEAGGDDGADTEAQRDFLRPVAAGAGAILSAGQHNEWGAIFAVPHGRLVDAHGLAVKLRHTALGSRHHLVFDADIAESAAGHDAVVAAAATEAIEVHRLHAVILQEQAGG